MPRGLVRINKENFMIDSPIKWKNNGLPRKGWELNDVIDTENIDNQCDWCGTSIRYLHFLHHKEDNLTTTCGCICAEHLTQDYINPKKKEKELKIFMRKKNKFLESFKIGKNCFYSKFFGFDKFVMVFQKKDDFFYLKIGNTWGKKSYIVFEQACIAAFYYLTK